MGTLREGLAGAMVLGLGVGGMVDTSSDTRMTDATDPEAPGGAEVGGVRSFGVGVAVHVPATGASDGGEAVPGYDEAAGRRGWGRPVADRVAVVVEKGEDAVRAATEAIAAQIGVTAQRIAASIEQQAVSHPAPGRLGLESVEISFGVTLTGGVQALFTAEAESSAQVTITLTRQPVDTAADTAAGRP
jgi:hypothetical protein